MNPPDIADLCKRLHLCAEQSEMGRNFADTPHACRESASELDRLYSLAKANNTLARMNGERAQAAEAEAARLREGLETIADLCDNEIKARWGGQSNMSIEEAAKGSRLYSLLVVPRNIARAFVDKGE